MEKQFDIFYAVEGQTTKAKDFKREVPYFLWEAPIQSLECSRIYTLLLFVPLFCLI